jgi:hypothetical protein
MDYQLEVFRERLRDYQRKIDGHKQNIAMTSALRNARINLAKAAVRMDLQRMFLMGLGKVASDAEIDALIENMPKDAYYRLVARRM